MKGIELCEYLGTNDVRWRGEGRVRVISGLSVTSGVAREDFV